MNPNQVVQSGELADITITTAAGRTHRLGKPTSRLFPLRLWLYKKREGIKIGPDGLPYSTKRGD